MESKIDFEGIEKRCEAATPAPWNTGPETHAGSVWVYSEKSPLLEPTHEVLKMFGLRSKPVTWNWQEDRPAQESRFWKQKQADAAFIAAARQDVPALIAHARALAEENRQAREDALEEAAKACEAMMSGQQTQGKEQTFKAHYIAQCALNIRALKGNAQR